ncbi:MAG: AraC family transcriptional regulator [Clostridiales bacterium]|nr:AraC family transcriptional regulator [Clostridiales bacterium]
MTVERRVLLELEGVSGFRELCSVSRDGATPPLMPHIHPDAIEICFLYRGEQDYSVGDECFHMRGLDLFMTYPNEVHGSGGAPEEKSVLYWMIVDTVNRTDRFLGFEGGEAAWLAGQLNRIPCRLFRGNVRVRTLWEEMYRLYDRPHPLRTLLLRCCALQLLNEVLCCSRAAARTTTADIRTVLDFVDEHINEWMPVGRLSEVCGLSETRFKQKFREQLGLPPGEYVMREKIRRAEALIRGGELVTTVAHRLGFSSSQYMASVFRKYRGISPGQIRPGR